MAMRNSVRGISLLAAALAVAVAACGSSSGSRAPAGSPPSGEGSSVAAASAAGQSAAPSAAPSAAQPSVDPVLAHASDAFAGLTSYHFHVTLTGGSYASSMAPDGIQGVAVYTPAFAVQFSYVDLEIIQTQDKIWTRNGASWDLSTYPGGKTTWDSFGPPSVLSHDFTPFVPYFSVVGDEGVNDVATTHYTANPAALGYFSGIYGFSGDATVAADVWIAKNGGYPVKFEIAASGTDEFDLTVDITRANDPANAIDVPAS
jgi:hypothetical protein